MIEAAAIVGALYALAAYGVGLRFYGAELVTTRPLPAHLRSVVFLMLSPLGVLVMLALLAVRGGSAFPTPPPQ